MALLLQMSIAGGLMSLAVALVRAAALHRLPKWTFVALWTLVALRLLVPLWIPAPCSVFNLLGDLQEETLGQRTEKTAELTASAELAATAGAAKPAEAAGSAEAATAASGGQASSAQVSGVYAGAQTTVDVGHATASGGGEPGSAASDSVEPGDAASGNAGRQALGPASRSINPATILAIVWTVGTLGCATAFAISYLRCRRRFADALPLADPRGRELAQDLVARAGLRRRVTLRQSDRIATPLTYGLLRPVVLVPAHFDWENTEQATYVLEHELVHVRRFDAALKLLLAAAVCIHWFNPLAWMAYVLANRDIELSCDEAVVRAHGISSRGAYARTLLSMGERESGLGPLLQSGFGKTALEERVGVVMKTKRTSLAAVVASLMLVAAIPAALATSAAEAPSVGGSTDAEQGTPGGDAASEKPGADVGDIASQGKSSETGQDQDEFREPEAPGAPPLTTSSLHFASFGGYAYTPDAPNPERPDSLLAAYSDEEWSMLTDFAEQAHAVFYPASSDANNAIPASAALGNPHTGVLSIAEFRAEALEVFGSAGGQALLDKLAADTELARYVQGVCYLTAADGTLALDDDVAVATLAYHALLPLSAQDWDAHTIEGSVESFDGSLVSYRLTMRVDDAELVSVNEYAYTAAWVEQNLQRAVGNPDATYATDGLTAEEIVRAALAYANQRTPSYGLTAELEVTRPRTQDANEDAPSRASATYALTDEEFAPGGAETGQSYREAGKDYARSLTAYRLFDQYEAFGISLDSIAVLGYQNDSAPHVVLSTSSERSQGLVPLDSVANRIFIDGTPVAQVYDPGYHAIASAWLGTVAVKAGCVDVVIDRDENGNLVGAHIAEAGEIERLMGEDTSVEAER